MTETLEPLQVTSWRALKQASIAVIIMMLGLIFAIANLYAHLSLAERQRSSWYAIATAAMFAVSIMFAVPLNCYFGQTEWEITSEGITSRSLAGRKRYIAWIAIREVKWLRNIAEFRNANSRIVLSLTQLPKEQQELVRERLVQLLSPHFDLSPTPRRVLTDRERVRSFCRITAVVAVVGVPLVVMVYRFPLSHYTVYYIGFLLAAFFVAMPAGIIAESRKANFPGRWRARR